jgi:hypothetical protein
MFGPQIPKTGTTSVHKCFSANHVYNGNKEADRNLIDPEKFLMLTATRSPLSRFFSSHSQIEAFTKIGWFDAMYYRKWWDLKVFNSNCQIGYWGTLGMGATQQLAPGTNKSGAHNAVDLDGDLDDIERRGFFDWHNHPMTAFFVAWEELGLVEHYNAFPDTTAMSYHR